MCGIFGYYNFNVPKDRRAILKLLINGLRRLEYRGYDSAGICVDTKAAYSNAQFSPQNGEPSADCSCSLMHLLNQEQWYSIYTKA